MFCFSRIFLFSIGCIYTPVLIDEFTLFSNLQRISLLYSVSTIKTNQIKFYGNIELDDQFYDSYANADTSQSDFDFENDELADHLDELELSDEDLDVYAEELNSMNESSITDTGFILMTGKLSTRKDEHGRMSTES